MQIAEILCISYDNARQRISKAKIKPITKEAIYPLDTPDKIKDVGPVGRPSKATEKAEKTEEARKLYLEIIIARDAYIEAINTGIFEDIFEKEKIFDALFKAVYKLRKYIPREKFEMIFEIPPFPKGYTKWCVKTLRTPKIPSDLLHNEHSPPKKHKEPNKDPKGNQEKTEKEELGNSGEET